MIEPVSQKPKPTAEPQSEAEHFIEFTRKIMSVPKEEIDAKQAEYHKQRIAERKRAARKQPTAK